MTERAAFFRAICERPADDGPRLAFADWLDEQETGPASAWSGLIRRQIAGTQGDIHAVKYRSADGRGWALVESADMPGGGTVIFGLPPDVGGVIRRGFLSTVHANAGTFLEHAPALFAAHPIQEVEIDDKRPYWNGRGWCWYNPGRQMPSGAVPESAEIPGRLFRLVRFDRRARRFVPFVSEGFARARLSAAAVWLGRKLVGLSTV